MFWIEPHFVCHGVWSLTLAHLSAQGWGFDLARGRRLGFDYSTWLQSGEFWHNKKNINKILWPECCPRGGDFDERSLLWRDFDNIFGYVKITTQYTVIPYSPFASSPPTGTKYHKLHSSTTMYKDYHLH